MDIDETDRILTAGESAAVALAAMFCSQPGTRDVFHAWVEKLDRPQARWNPSQEVMRSATQKMYWNTSNAIREKRWMTLPISRP